MATEEPGRSWCRSGFDLSTLSVKRETTLLGEVEVSKFDLMRREIQL